MVRGKDRHGHVAAGKILNPHQRIEDSRGRAMVGWPDHETIGQQLLLERHVVRGVRPGHDHHLAIWPHHQVGPAARDVDQRFRARERAELLRARVAGDAPGQAPEPDPLAAGEQDRPEIDG